MASLIRPSQAHIAPPTRLILSTPAAYAEDPRP